MKERKLWLSLLLGLLVCAGAFGNSTNAVGAARANHCKDRCNAAYHHRQQECRGLRHGEKHQCEERAKAEHDQCRHNCR